MNQLKGKFKVPDVSGELEDEWRERWLELERERDEKWEANERKKFEERRKRAAASKEELQPWISSVSPSQSAPFERHRTFERFPSILDRNTPFTPFLFQPRERPRSNGLYGRIEAVQHGLKKIGHLPREDEEIHDLAISLAGDISRRGLFPEISSTLCDQCKEIPMTWLLESPRNSFTLFEDFRKLRESAMSCALCDKIFRSIEHLCDEEILAINAVVAPQFLVIEVMSDVDCKYSLLRILCTDPASQAASIGMQVGFPILSNADTPFHYHLLNQWLHDCDLHHDDHKYPSDENTLPELPTRVLEVQTPEGQECLRLRHTSGACGKYIALSHRWGDDKPEIKLKTRPITTKANVAEHYKEIRFDNDLRTFRDAVKVTRQLGVQYLWIDSLCIIQPDGNDDSDWERESKRMDSIFANAYCTIAATSAEHSWDGFLRSRPVEPSVKLPNNIYVCEEVGGMFVKNFAHHLMDGELSKRAWVLQERVLSRRTIHFTAAQIYWECGSVIRYENLNQFVKPTDFFSSSRFPMTVSGPLSGGAASTFEEVFSRYSKLDLTQQKDRPYAVYGLQSRLEEFYKTKCTYGIVHCCLLKSLLWQRADKDRMKEIKNLTRTTPSWSWMSLQGAICYGKVPSVNIRWSRDVKLIFPSSNGQDRCILEAPTVQISEHCCVGPIGDSSCKIEDDAGSFLGWIRFDCKDEVDIRNLGCVLLAQQKSNGWTESVQDTWEDFADILGVSKIFWDEGWKLKNPSYVLVVTRPARKEGYQEEVCRRLGVAVMQVECLQLSPGQAQISWVL